MNKLQYRNGKMFRKTIDVVFPETTTRKLPRGDGTNSKCCCPPKQFDIWFALWPCSEPIPEDPLGCTDHGDCWWITQERRDELVEEAIDRGLIDPEWAPEFWPDYLVVYVAETQACYSVTLGGYGSIGPGWCPFICVTSAPPGESPGPEASVFLVGLDCCDEPCPCDEGDPLPPVEDEDPPIEINDCVITRVRASINVGVCNCGNNFNFGNFEGVNAQNVPLRNVGGGGAVWIGHYEMKWISCSDPGDTENWRVEIVAELCGVGGWKAVATAYRWNVAIPGWTAVGEVADCPVCNGDCFGGSPANVNVACGPTSYGLGGTIDIVATVVP